MRRLLLLAVLAAAGCGDSSQPTQQREDLQTYDSAESSSDASAPPPSMVAPMSADRSADSSAGPNVAPTAAPGVAFNYRYAFRLEAPRIAEVQEQHAQMCERLTIARCRITGMRYRVVNDRDIEAMLAFKLDPAVARHFGRAGVEAVVRAEGMLTESEITGADVGTDIRRAGRSIAQMTAELRRIEARLGQRGLSAEERSRLDYEAQQLRQSIRAFEASREEQQESLATTPMTFRYGSGDLVPGFDREPSFGQALERALDNVAGGMLVLFVVVVTLLPWILLALLIGLGIRAVRRRWFSADRPEPQVSPAATP